MKVMDFLDVKGDAWGIKYYNSILNEYEPSLQDTIKSVRFLKSGESGAYHVYTDSLKDFNIDNVSIADVKKYCAQTMDCKQCVIREFCNKNIKTCPNKW